MNSSRIRPSSTLEKSFHDQSIEAFLSLSGLLGDIRKHETTREMSYSTRDRMQSYARRIGNELVEKEEYDTYWDKVNKELWEALWDEDEAPEQVEFEKSVKQSETIQGCKFLGLDEDLFMIDGKKFVQCLQQITPEDLKERNLRFILQERVKKTGELHDQYVQKLFAGEQGTEQFNSFHELVGHRKEIKKLYIHFGDHMETCLKNYDLSDEVEALEAGALREFVVFGKEADKYGVYFSNLRIHLLLETDYPPKKTTEELSNLINWVERQHSEKYAMLAKKYIIPTIEAHIKMFKENRLTLKQDIPELLERVNNL